MGIELVSRPATWLQGALPAFARNRVAAGVAAALAVGAVGAPSTASAVDLADGLSVSGFLDMSYFVSDPDGAPTSRSFGVDQFELDFTYTGSNGISAQVDIEYGENASDIIGGDDTFVEQAFITKQFNDQFSVKVGRFLSYSGWETEEPTGLFQYSATGYGASFYGYYQQGISAKYDGGTFAIMGSIVNDVFGYADGPLERETKKPGYEVGVALMPFEGFTAKAFYMSDDKTDRDVFNVWASYAVNNFTFAAEYNDADYGAAGDGDGYLLMGNYTRGNGGITLRYHNYTDDSQAFSGNGFTISPSYKLSDNLLLVAEYRLDDIKGAGDVNSFALEALFTF